MRRSGRDRSCYLAAVWQKHQLADATLKRSLWAQPAHPAAGSFVKGKFSKEREREERKREGRGARVPS